jgi:hypothetical protein
MWFNSFIEIWVRIVQSIICFVIFLIYGDDNIKTHAFCYKVSWSIKCYRHFGGTCWHQLLQAQILQPQYAAVITTELPPRLQPRAFRRAGALQKAVVENENSADVYKPRSAFDIWGSHSGVYEGSRFVGCYTVSFDKFFPTFWRTIIFFLQMHSVVPQNFTKYSPSDTA